METKKSDKLIPQHVLKTAFSLKNILISAISLWSCNLDNSCTILHDSRTPFFLKRKVIMIALEIKNT